MKQQNQFLGNRYPVRGNSGTEYRRFVFLLRLPGAEGPAGGKYDMGPTQAGYFWRSGDSRGSLKGFQWVGAGRSQIPSVVGCAEIVRQSKKYH